MYNHVKQDSDIMRCCATKLYIRILAMKKTDKYLDLHIYKITIPPDSDF